MALQTRKQTTSKGEEHLHNFYLNPYNRSEEVCKNLYNGRPCLALKVSNAEWERRNEEWRNFYALCQQTEAKRDYDLMCDAFKRKDQKEMKEILKRVNKRCQVKTDEFGDNDFTFSKEEYLDGPSFPDPANPKSVYFFEGGQI